MMMMMVVMTVTQMFLSCFGTSARYVLFYELQKESLHANLCFALQPWLVAFRSMLVALCGWDAMGFC